MTKVSVTSSYQDIVESRLEICGIFKILWNILYPVKVSARQRIAVRRSILPVKNPKHLLLYARSFWMSEGSLLVSETSELF